MAVGATSSGASCAVTVSGSPRSSGASFRSIAAVSRTSGIADSSARRSRSKVACPSFVALATNDRAARLARAVRSWVAGAIIARRVAQPPHVASLSPSERLIGSMSWSRSRNALQSLAALSIRRLADPPRSPVATASHQAARREAARSMTRSGAPPVNSMARGLRRLSSSSYAKGKAALNCASNAAKAACPCARLRGSSRSFAMRLPTVAKLRPAPGLIAPIESMTLCSMTMRWRSASMDLTRSSADRLPGSLDAAGSAAIALNAGASARTANRASRSSCRSTSFRSRGALARSEFSSRSAAAHASMMRVAARARSTSPDAPRDSLLSIDDAASDSAARDCSVISRVERIESIARAAGSVFSRASNALRASIAPRSSAVGDNATTAATIRCSEAASAASEMGKGAPEVRMVTSHPTVSVARSRSLRSCAALEPRAIVASSAAFIVDFSAQFGSASKLARISAEERHGAMRSGEAARASMSTGQGSSFCRPSSSSASSASGASTVPSARAVCAGSSCVGDTIAFRIGSIEALAIASSRRMARLALSAESVRYGMARPPTASSTSASIRPIKSASRAPSTAGALSFHGLMAPARSRYAAMPRTRARALAPDFASPVRLAAWSLSARNSASRSVAKSVAPLVWGIDGPVGTPPRSSVWAVAAFERHRHSPIRMTIWLTIWKAIWLAITGIIRRVFARLIPEQGRDINRTAYFPQVCAVQLPLRTRSSEGRVPAEEASVPRRGGREPG